MNQTLSTELDFDLCKLISKANELFYEIYGYGRLHRRFRSPDVFIRNGKLIIDWELGDIKADIEQINKSIPLMNELKACLEKINEGTANLAEVQSVTKVINN